MKIELKNYKEECFNIVAENEPKKDLIAKCIDHLIKKNLSYNNINGHIIRGGEVVGWCTEFLKSEYNNVIEDVINYVFIIEIKSSMDRLKRGYDLK